MAAVTDSVPVSPAPQPEQWPAAIAVPGEGGVGEDVAVVPVSVVIPCYNYAQFLDDAVASALAQTVRPLEILLIDDGSTDNTRELAARYPAPVRYVWQENAGLSAARNRGIQEARGEFIAFLDADDAYAPEMLARCLAEFSRLGSGFGLVAVQPRAIDGQGQPIPRAPMPGHFAGEVTSRQLLVKNRFVPTVMVRRAVFGQVGDFDTELRSCEDREMWIRVGTVCRMWLLDEPLALKRSHGTNMSGNAARQSANIEKVLRKSRRSGVVAGSGNPLLWAKAWSFYFYQSSLMFWGNGNWPMALANVLRSLVLWPVHGDHVALVQPPLFRVRWLARMAVDFLSGRTPRPVTAGGSEIRVMHVVNSLEPGGMENGVVNMAHALDGRGQDIRIASLGQAGEFQERLPHPEKLSALGKGGGFSVKHALALGRHFRAERTRVAHTHNLGPLIYTVLAIASSPRLWGRVRILHGEHAELNESERTGKRLLQRKLFYRACRLVHTVSHSLKEDLVRIGLPAERIAVAVNGVDTQRFCPLAEPREAALAWIGLGGIPADALVLGMVGRFGQYKRHDFLVKAFTGLAAARPDAHLVLVGDKGPERERIHALVAASPVRERIHLAGFQRDVVGFYQCFDLLVVPSINEGLSNAVLEAMATGLPILASSACGNREVMDDGVDGFVRDLGTPQLLETALVALVAAPEKLREVGAEARARVVRQFSLESMAARYAELYRVCGG